MGETIKTPTRSLSISPLLSDKVIERDYTKGIEQQLGDNNNRPPAPPNPGQPDPPPPPPGPSAPNDSHDFNQQNIQEPSGFKFEEVADPSDVTGDEGEGFNLAATSAKSFANIVGDIIKVKVPEISYGFVKVDTNSIEAHIVNGNINPSLRDVFHQINAGTLEALQFSDDEIKMWKKAFKDYLEYKNIAAANPETAFWIATGVLVVTQGFKIRELNKVNKQYIVDAINSFNPSYFDSFKAKTESAPPKAQAAPAAKPTEAENIKTEKTTV